MCQELKANGCRKSIDEVVTDTVHRVQQETECMTPIVEYTLGKKTYLTDFQPTCDTQWYLMIKPTKSGQEVFTNTGASVTSSIYFQIKIYREHDCYKCIFQYYNLHM